MPPSKKIFIGASAIITGVLGQIILEQLLTRSVLSVPAIQENSSASAELLDQRLERLHEQTSIGLNALTISYVFIVAGLLFLLVGIYQNARATERLQTVIPSSSSIEPGGV